MFRWWIMSQQILYREYARKALVKGIKTMAETVAITLGPSGRNVVLSKKLTLPQIVNDGITIAKEVMLDDCIENVGISLIRQVTAKTNDVTGDGTTTATVLAYAIIYHGMKNLASGVNSIELTRGIRKAVQFLENKIVEYAKPINTALTLAQIATISSGNDHEVGFIIANALEKVGREGIVSLEEGQYISTQLEITRGMKLEKGFISQHFAANEDLERIIQNSPYILLTDQKITLVQQELVPILELVAKTNRPLLILAEDVTTEILSTLIINRLKGIIDVVAVRSPGFGEYRKLLLEDISIFTGGTIISKDVGLAFNSISLNMLGQANKIIITKDSTTIITDKNQQLVNMRCHQLRKQIQASNLEYEKEKLKSRLGKLSARAALIKVGAVTEVQMKEKKLRLEDALNATRAAIEEGIVPGGGSAGVHLAKELKVWAQKNLLSDELIGALMVQQALLIPAKKIVQNAGAISSIIIDKIMDSNFEVGYDVISGSFRNMYIAGIIDPAKVLRSAIQNAASVASMVLIAECVIFNNKNIT